MGIGIGSAPFAEKKFAEIRGRCMAYIDVGEGAPIVFLHGNPTSSYLWRNILPACTGLGRLIACDFIGMGDSEKLPASGANSYGYFEHREFLFALWDELNLGNQVIFVAHDWGTWLAIDWARHNPDRVQGIAYMESIMIPLEWSDVPDAAREPIRLFRSPAGDEMILRDNFFVERILPGMVLRELSREEMEHYRRPYLNPGEDRRPTLAAPRQLPIAGEPADVAEVVAANAEWLAKSDLPKLYVHAEPGALDQGRQRDFCRSLQNQTEITVKGLHFPQEDSPEDIGVAIADFVQKVREK